MIVILVKHVFEILDNPKLVSGKQKDIFEDILEDRRHSSDAKWAWHTRDVPLYKYTKPRSPEEIKKHVMQSDRVKYAMEQVSENNRSIQNKIINFISFIHDDKSFLYLSCFVSCLKVQIPIKINNAIHC